MSTRFQDRLIHVALCKGYLDTERVREAFRGLAERRCTGRKLRLDHVLREMGLLTQEQLADVRRTMAREAPPRLGDLEILSRIGAGAIGTVYRARQRRLDRIVAVKVLAGHLAHDEAFVRRFLREARLAARVSHPNVVQVYDVGRWRGSPHIVMEYVPGASLEQVIVREGRVSETLAASIGLQIGRAVQYASAHGLVHRDIKPANILLKEDGAAKLADLGLAMAPGEEAESRVGTPFYMSPEQARSDLMLDSRSDIYSLGCTLFRAVTGRVPFQGPTVAETLRMHAESPRPDAAALRPELSPDFCSTLRRMMAKQPEERYAGPAEFVAAIERLTVQRTSAGRGEPR